MKSPGKFTSRTSWRAKLEKPHERKFVDLKPGEAGAKWGVGRMLIARPIDVDAAVRLVRKGTLATMTELREKLARDAGADFACPLTTGIFLRIAAEAAEEDRSAGGKSLTPWWRILKADGTLNEKLPGGPGLQKKLLEGEGFDVVKKGRGKALTVAGFEKHVTPL